MTLPGLYLLLFLDGVTLGAATNPLLVEAGKTHEAWMLAVFGGLASALGNLIQLWGMRWVINKGIEFKWARRFAPSEDKLRTAMQKYKRASFLAIVVVRATPVPDLPLKLVAAAGGYPIPLYGLAVWLGALPYYYVLARIGKTFQPSIWIIVGAFAFIALVGWLEGLRRKRARRRAATGS